MKRVFLCSALACGAMHVCALAQVPRPDFYVWTYKTPQETPATASTCVAPALKPFALLDGWNSWKLWIGPGDTGGGDRPVLSQFLIDNGVRYSSSEEAAKPLTPDLAALLAADEILRRRETRVVRAWRLDRFEILFESAGTRSSRRRGVPHERRYPRPCSA